jgi:hypothetical protein
MSTNTIEIEEQNAIEVQNTIEVQNATGEQNAIEEQHAIEIQNATEGNGKKIRRKIINKSLNENDSPERKRVKTKLEIIVIPTYESYNDFLNNKFTGFQLKQICKFYKLNCTGTKQVLTNMIYKHLFLSFNASIIQNIWRKHAVKRYARLHGPAQFKRALCVNETDFFTMDDIKDIPYTQFFSYKDSDNMIYGFDIMSLYNLIIKKDDVDILNPYTRNPIHPLVKRNFKSLIYLSKLLKEEIQLDMEDKETVKDNLHSIEYHAITIFHEIDRLGNYTNPTWFLELQRHQLLVYARELYDIWTYRAQLSDQVKNDICPNGNPFNTIHLADLPGLTLRELQNSILTLIDNFFKNGSTQHSRYLGSTYVLCALTLVSPAAAEALPWLYESVAVIQI